jgi:hypothetical protein
MALARSLRSLASSQASGGDIYYRNDGALVIAGLMAAFLQLVNMLGILIIVIARTPLFLRLSHVSPPSPSFWPHCPIFLRCAIDCRSRANMA